MCHRGHKYNKQGVSELPAEVGRSFLFIRKPCNLIITSSGSGPARSVGYYIWQVHLGCYIIYLWALLIRQQARTKPVGVVLRGAGLA